jgi:1-acyl-sn-glycerol-3-phosphate acyltransferase
LVLAFFRHIVRRYLRRHFRAVRLAGKLPPLPDGPLLIYANHGSWWDPMVSFFLAEALWPRRRHYAPMDAAMLRRYRIFTHLGIFPVTQESARGAVEFLRTSAALLEAGSVVWVTPQGRFVDPQARPLTFKPGLASLAMRVRPLTVLPLAIEYTFWDERLPELLLRFGEPIVLPGPLDGTLPRDTAAMDALLIERLEQTMNHLRADAITRSGASFQTLLSGARGSGGIYAVIQRALALVTGRPYQPDHTPSTPEQPTSTPPHVRP